MLTFKYHIKIKMYGFSLIEKFKSLDIYRKLPSDYVQPTYSGAMCK